MSLATRKSHFLGVKLHALRKRNGLTLEELSARCIQLDAKSAPSVSYLSMIESGKRVPSEEVLGLLSSLFQREPRWFLDGNPETVFRQLQDLNLESGENSRLLTSVQRVVDCLLDRGQECLLGIIKSQEVAILGEKLRYRYVALACCHAFGGFAASGTALGRGRRG